MTRTGRGPSVLRRPMRRPLPTHRLRFRQPFFASRSSSGHLRPWQAGLEQKLPPSVAPLDRAVAHRARAVDLRAVVVHPVRRLVAVRRRQAGRDRRRDRALRRFPAATCGSAWQSVHCRRIASPFSFMCLPSWQRKQPGEVLVPDVVREVLPGERLAVALAGERRQHAGSAASSSANFFSASFDFAADVLRRCRGDDLRELRRALLVRAADAGGLLDDRVRARLDRRQAAVDAPFLDRIVDEVSPDW